MGYWDYYHILRKILETDYGRLLSDVEITDRRGYWRDKKPCAGKDCPFAKKDHQHFEGDVYHLFLVRETYPRDQWGRFESPYRVWHYYHQAKTRYDPHDFTDMEV